jgi:hypothetical protein
MPRYFATDLVEGYSLLCRLGRDSEFRLLTVIEGILRSPASEAVGAFRGLAIDLNPADPTELFLNLEGCSHASMELWCALLDQGKPLAPLPEAGNSALLYLERLCISPEHRRRQLGLATCAAIMALFTDRCACAAMKPFPLQWEGKLENPGSDRQYRKDLRRLVSYYAPLGFIHGPYDEHYYRELKKGQEILGFTSASWTRKTGVRLPDLSVLDACLGF